MHWICWHGSGERIDARVAQKCSEEYCSTSEDVEVSKVVLAPVNSMMDVVHECTTHRDLPSFENLPVHDAAART